MGGKWGFHLSRDAASRLSCPGTPHQSDQKNPGGRFLLHFSAAWEVPELFNVRNEAVARAEFFQLRTQRPAFEKYRLRQDNAGAVFFYHQLFDR